MSEQQTVIHKTVVVHEYARPKRRPMRAAARLLWGTWRLVPFSGIITSIVVLVMALVVARAVTPNYDVPWVPFVSCEDGQPAEDVGTVATVAHRAGSVVSNLRDGAPSVAALKTAMLETAADAGRLWGTVKAGFDGEPLPESPQKRGGPQAAPVSCTPCPTTGGGEVLEVSSESGALTAARAAVRAGFRGEDAVTAVAIAAAESGYRPDAANPTSNARGMWQIMTTAHPEKLRGRDVFDPVDNAAVAREVWREAKQRGRDPWSPWAVYTSGAYKAHLDEAREAVAQVGGSGCGQFVTQTRCDTSKVRLTGLTPDAENFAACVESIFGISELGGVGQRSNASYHPSGRAIDVMVTGRKGDEVAAWARGHAAALGVTEVIWKQRIWTAARADEGWRMMEDRGSATANHWDHVHVSLADGYVTAGKGQAT